MEILARLKKNKRNKILMASIKEKKLIKNTLSKYIIPNIPKLFFIIGEGIKFVITPIFTAKSEKTGKVEFKAPYLYVFIMFCLLVFAVSQFIYLIHAVAFSTVNEPGIVLSACGGLVATLIIIIDRVLSAYNKGKNGHS